MDFKRRDAEQEKKKKKIHKIYKISLACEQEILNVNARECPKIFFSLNCLNLKKVDTFGSNATLF